jgi:hypothetical protein
MLSIDDIRRAHAEEKAAAAEKKARKTRAASTSAELVFLALIVVGVFMLAGTGWASLVAGVAGIVWLELPELLALIASPRGRKR